MDLNHRTLTRADLQSAAIDHSATPPLDFLGERKKALENLMSAEALPSSLERSMDEGGLYRRLSGVSDCLTKVKIPYYFSAFQMPFPTGIKPEATSGAASPKLRFRAAAPAQPSLLRSFGGHLIFQAA